MRRAMWLKEEEELAEVVGEVVMGFEFQGQSIAGAAQLVLCTENDVKMSRVFRGYWHLRK